MQKQLDNLSVFVYYCFKESQVLKWKMKITLEY